MLAAGAIRLRHSPDGGIQWLLVKPGISFWVMCIASPWPNAMVIETDTIDVSFFVVVNVLFAHNRRY